MLVKANSLSLSYPIRSPKPGLLTLSALKSQIHPAKAPSRFPLNRCLMPPESDVISPVEAVSKSLLDKPLNQLTDDDISQLTREDCRRYLKEKGMRRPSWNKSQAIQQVISLKALLEMPPDSDSGSYKKLYAPRSPSNSNNHESRVSKETDIDAEISESAEVMPFRGKNLEKTDLFGDLPAHPVGAVKDSAPSRQAYFYFLHC
nr:protein TIFY 4B-like isoform X3 [Ipomoea batatas]